MGSETDYKNSNLWLSVKDCHPSTVHLSVKQSAGERVFIKKTRYIASFSANIGPGIGEDKK